MYNTAHNKSIVLFLPRSNSRFRFSTTTSKRLLCITRNESSHSLTMCDHYKITENWACGHSYDVTTQCKEVYSACQENSNHRQFSLKPATEGILSKMFRFSSARKDNLPARFKQINDICQHCKNRQIEKRARDRSPRRATHNATEVRAQQVLRATKTVRAGKDHFQCSKCKREGRHPVCQAQRAVNNGLCCDNGRIEWEAAEKLTESKSVRAPVLSSNGHSLSSRANTQPERRAHGPTTAVAQKAVNQAAQSYGWSREQPLQGRSNATREERTVTAVGYDPTRARIQVRDRDSTHLEPGLARDFARVPVYALLPTHPTQRTEQGTWYKEPGIDLDRWGSHPRTDHGSIPIPPPQSALPQQPSRSEQRARDVLRRKPVPQTPQNSRPNEPSSSRNNSLQRTSPQHLTKLGPQTPQRQPPPRSNIFPPTPPTTHSSSGYQPPSAPRRRLTNEYTRSRHPLRSTRGREWHNSADLATKSPPITPVTNTRSQAPQSRISGQDITSVSRLNEPFSPADWDWDEEDGQEMKARPLSFGTTSRLYASQDSQPLSSRVHERGSQRTNVEDLINNTITSVEHWGRDLRMTPSLPPSRRRH